MFTILLEDLHIKKVSNFIAPNLVLSILAETFRDEKKKKKRLGGSNKFIVKFGRPNYKEREFIKACKKANEPFPIKKLQIKYL